jgi:hypothetical protein
VLFGNFGKGIELFFCYFGDNSVFGTFGWQKEDFV